MAAVLRSPRASSYRVTLTGSAALRLPGRVRSVQVVSGSGWVTVDGQDLIVNAGEVVVLPAGHDAVVSSSHHQRAVDLKVYVR